MHTADGLNCYKYPPRRHLPHVSDIPCLVRQGAQWRYQWMGEQVLGGLQELIDGSDDFLELLDYCCKIPACSNTPDFQQPRGPVRQRQLSQPRLQLRERANDDLGTPVTWKMG